MSPARAPRPRAAPLFSLRALTYFYHFMPAVCHCAPGPAHSLLAVHPSCTYGSAPLHTVLLAVTSPPRSRSIMPHAYPKDTPPRPTALALRLQIASACICLHLARRLQMQASKARWICRVQGARRKGESRRLYPSLMRGQSAPFACCYHARDGASLLDVRPLVHTEDEIDIPG